MVHDFEQFPELKDSQMQFYYFESPHKQIFEDFGARVERVIDGDTIEVSWYQRDFLFPVRLAKVAAPEKKELGGDTAKDFLESIVEGEEVLIRIDHRNRVGKWGRIIGTIIFKGLDVNEELVRTNHAKTWEGRNEGKLPNINKVFPPVI